MNPNSKDPFGIEAPNPCPKAKEKAWQAAAFEFHQSQTKQLRDPKSHSVIRLMWPVAAVATIAILCGLLVTQQKQKQSQAQGQPPTQIQSSSPPDLAQLYSQGRQLFGNKLEAVTVSKNQVIWLLSEDLSPEHRTDQFVTLTLYHQNAPNLYIAASPGTPLDVPYQGKTHQVEFLPNASDQIIAIGNDIYWDSALPGSPMSDLRIQMIKQD